MRTKTLLIASAVALTAAITSSQAQTVYSANIVGYVNTVFPVGQFTLVTSPLGGASNSIDVLIPALQNGDEVLTWNPVNLTYTTWSYIGAGANQPGGTGYGNWTTNDTTYSDSPTVAPGGSFFYANGQGSPETNTFTGNVQLTNSIALPAGQFDLVASTVPIADYVDDPTNFTIPFQNGDEVLTWNPATLAYTTWSYIGAGYNQPGGTGYGNWTTNDTTYSYPPFVTVGQGFFYANGQSGTETWNQNDSYINP
jgi:hypothetical protein